MPVIIVIKGACLTACIQIYLGEPLPDNHYLMNMTLTAHQKDADISSSLLTIIDHIS